MIILSRKSDNETIGERIVSSGNSFPLVLRRLLKDRAALAGLAVFAVICLACAFAPYMTKWDYTEINVRRLLEGPSADHILGTDNLGRDVYARLLYGGRITLRIAAVSTLLAAAAGCVVGLAAGYSGGRADLLASSVLDIFAAIPVILLAIVFETVLGWGRGYFMYAIAIAAMPQFAHLVRACVMNIVKLEYIEAARALGVGRASIILRHILRNIISPLIIRLASSFAEALLSCTIMGYLSIGMKPPTPEWGVIVHNAKSFVRKQPLLIVFPCAVITICIVSLSFFSDGLRDALSPVE